jgi:hypothetical protein
MSFFLVTNSYCKEERRIQQQLYSELSDIQQRRQILEDETSALSTNVKRLKEKFETKLVEISNANKQKSVFEVNFKEEQTKYQLRRQEKELLANELRDVTTSMNKIQAEINQLNPTYEMKAMELKSLTEELSQVILPS